jgi:hypothetical protein
MSVTVWKFPLEIVDEQRVMLPKEHEWLRIDMQGDTLCGWAIVDPKGPKEEVLIRIAGTGHPIEYPQFMDGIDRNETDILDHIDTFFVKGGELVFHAFEVYEGR